MHDRRTFLAQVGGAAAGAMLFDPAELRAGTAAAHAGAWDTSWLDRLATAKYRAVFNGSDINDGAILDLVATFFDGYRDAHGSPDADLRPVVVFRRLGTVMAFNDAMWDKYGVGADRGVKDHGAPARRNVFWKADPGRSATIEALQRRGLIVLVCNIATTNVAHGIAQKTGQDPDTVYNEVKANLVPGAILVPSGIYGLIRAQNAGCAYMHVS
ncbi:MAG TPA: hypothetical protein VG916_06935 [Gemmatimonadaceae bacterium]|nr:hypothetical protein [Gemmatimonadaceae bacterium]